MTTGDFAFPEATVGAWLAFGLIVIGLLSGRGLLMPAGVAVLFSLFMVEVLYGTLSTVQAVVIAVALLAAAELGYWSIEVQATVPRSKAAILRRARVIVALAVGGVAITGAGLIAIVR